MLEPFCLCYAYMGVYMPDCQIPSTCVSPTILNIVLSMSSDYSKLTWWLKVTLSPPASPSLTCQPGECSIIYSRVDDVGFHVWSAAWSPALSTYSSVNSLPSLPCTLCPYISFLDADSQSVADKSLPLICTPQLPTILQYLMLFSFLLLVHLIMRNSAKYFIIIYDTDKSYLYS